MPAQPAAAAGIRLGGKAALHRAHGLKVAERPVAGPHRLNGGHLALFVQSFQAGHGGMQAEKAVEVHQAASPCPGFGQANGGA